MYLNNINKHFIDIFSLIFYYTDTSKYRISFDTPRISVLISRPFHSDSFIINPADTISVPEFFHLVVRTR